MFKLTDLFYFLIIYLRTPPIAPGDRFGLLIFLQTSNSIKTNPDNEIARITIKELEKYMNACLLLIDLQNDYFAGGNMELVNIGQVAENAQQLLEIFRNKDLPVIHIQHISTRPGASFFLPNTHGVEIHEMVSPLKNEPIVKKNYPNSFRETALLEILNETKKDTVVICGAMSHMCVDATTRAAFDFGFNCVVVEDACATRDLVFKGKTIKSTDVHASFMAALSAPYAQVLKTSEVLERML